MGTHAQIGFSRPRCLSAVVIFIVLFGVGSWWGSSPTGIVEAGPIIGGSHPPPAETIELHVQLSPSIVPGLVERCIVFAFYEDCGVEPVQCSALVAFGDPLAPGIGMATIDVDASCPVNLEEVFAVTAVDPLHTVRSVGEMTQEADTLIVSFEGDPENGGHWLVGGNLDAWDSATSPANADTINILDFGVFVSQYLRSYPDGGTDCGATGPHADINGDAVVNVLDFAFIMGNFLAESDNPVCVPFVTDPPALSEISVVQLLELGLDQLVIADINRDGWLNIDDMRLFRRKRFR